MPFSARTSATRGPTPFTYCTGVLSSSIEVNVSGGSELKSNFRRALVAVLAGNAVYFLLMPYLPPALRHQAYRIDLGLLVDAAICTAIVLALWAWERRRS